MESAIGGRFAAAEGDADMPLIARKPFTESSEIDMTAMIDLVFMMNIFFLVTTLTQTLAEVDLPVAKRAVAADLEKSVIITLIAAGPRQAAVYLGDGAKGQPLTDQMQDQAIREAVEQGFAQGKNTVLIKAEKAVLHRDVNRVATVAASVEGVKLNLAVAERD